jgi:glycosyltransferase involved in cell wall biosynthesis
MSLLTIVTINLNNKLGLQRTLNSLKKQNKKKTRFELIVIDGGSTDGSVDIIKNNLKIIDYYVSEKDRNLYEAMNKGIRRAKNKYIIFINSGETLFSKNTIEKILLRLTDEVNYVFKFYVRGYGCVWKSGKNKICHEAIAFLNKKEIFYNLEKSPFADAEYINLNFKRYNKVFKNLFIINFYLGGMSNTFSKYHKNFSILNIIKFIIYKFVNPKLYHLISYKLKGYQRLK